MGKVRWKFLLEGLPGKDWVVVKGSGQIEVKNIWDIACSGV